jgi:hypothetical protein
MGSVLVPFSAIPSSLFLLTDTDRFRCISSNGLIRDIISDNWAARVVDASDHIAKGQSTVYSKNCPELWNDLVLQVDIHPAIDTSSMIFLDPMFGITVLCEFNLPNTITKKTRILNLSIDGVEPIQVDIVNQNWTFSYLGSTEKICLHSAFSEETSRRGFIVLSVKPKQMSLMIVDEILGQKASEHKIIRCDLDPSSLLKSGTLIILNENCSASEIAAITLNCVAVWRKVGLDLNHTWSLILTLQQGYNMTELLVSLIWPVLQEKIVEINFGALDHLPCGLHVSGPWRLIKPNMTSKGFWQLLNHGGLSLSIPTVKPLNEYSLCIDMRIPTIQESSVERDPSFILCAFKNNKLTCPSTVSKLFKNCGGTMWPEERSSSGICNGTKISIVAGKVSVFNKSSPKKLSFSHWTRLIISVDLYNSTLLLACDGDIVFNSKSHGCSELQQSLKRDSLWSLQSLSLFPEIVSVCEIGYLHIIDRALPKEDLRQLSIYQEPTEEFMQCLLRHRLGYKSTEIGKKKFKHIIDQLEKESIKKEETKPSRSLKDTALRQQTRCLIAVSSQKKACVPLEGSNDESAIDTWGCKPYNVHNDSCLLSGIRTPETEVLNPEFKNTPPRSRNDGFNVIESNIEHITRRNEAYELCILSEYLVFNNCKNLEKNWTTDSFDGDATILSSLTGFSYASCYEQLQKKSLRIIRRNRPNVLPKQSSEKGSSEEIG